MTFGQIIQDTLKRRRTSLQVKPGTLTENPILANLASLKKKSLFDNDSLQKIYKQPTNFSIKKDKSK